MTAAEFSARMLAEYAAAKTKADAKKREREAARDSAATWMAAHGEVEDL